MTVSISDTMPTEPTVAEYAALANQVNALTDAIEDLTAKQQEILSVIEQFIATTKPYLDQVGPFIAQIENSPMIKMALGIKSK